MDDIFQIMLYVGIMVILTVFRSKTKPVATSPKPETDEEEAMEEVFPTFTPQESVQPVSFQSKAAHKKKKNASFKPATPAPVVSKPVKETPKIRLNTREEARRAFIYSEIFNRKY